MEKKSSSPTEIPKVVAKVEIPKSVAEPKKPEPKQPEPKKPEPKKPEHKQPKPEEKKSSKIDYEVEIGRTLHTDYDEIIPPCRDM